MKSGKNAGSFARFPQLFVDAAAAAVPSSKLDDVNFGLSYPISLGAKKYPPVIDVHSYFSLSQWKEELTYKRVTQFSTFPELPPSQNRAAFSPPFIQRSSCKAHCNPTLTLPRWTPRRACSLNFDLRSSPARASPCFFFLDCFYFLSPPLPACLTLRGVETNSSRPSLKGYRHSTCMP